MGERSKDNFGIQLFEHFGWLPREGKLRESPVVASAFMYGMGGVFAYLWYLVRGGSGFVCFLEVLSGLALVPQLWMFTKDKRVSPALGYFVALTAASRLCTLAFWVSYPYVRY